MSGGYTPRAGRILRVLLLTAAGLLLLAVPHPAGAAGRPGADVLRVERQAVLWYSATLRRAGGSPGAAPAGEPLGRLAYDHHFDTTGAPPDWPFLERLRPAPPELARLRDDVLVFARSGRRTPLPEVDYPPAAVPGRPSLYAGPRADWVLLAFPFFRFNAKQTEYVTFVYSADGTRRWTLDSLPTHALAGAPATLVNPERAGCCESMRWNVHFYDLDTLTEHRYTCPEGHCGDLLLARPRADGPVLLVEETVGRVDGAGVFMETHVYVLARDGRAVASGTYVYAVPERLLLARKAGLQCACAWRNVLSGMAPYAARNLIALRAAEDGAWALHIAPAGAPAQTWHLQGTQREPTPAVRFAAKPQRWPQSGARAQDAPAG